MSFLLQHFQEEMRDRGANEEVVTAEREDERKGKKTSRREGGRDSQ